MNEIEKLTRYSHEYTDETLKCKLCESLKKILWASQEGSKQAEDGGPTFVNLSATITSFNDEFLRVAIQKIDWRYICSQYDFYCVDQNSSSCVSPPKMKSTTLEMLLDCFENPTIWPSACLTTTFRVLIEVFYVEKVDYDVRTFSVKGNNEQVELTPSQTRILHFLTMVMQRNQCMHNLSFWTAGHNIWVFNGISTSHHGEIALKLLRYWFLKLPYCRMVWISLLSHLIAVIDALEASLSKKLKDIEGTDIAEEEKITTQHRQYHSSTSNYSRNRSIRQSSLFDFQNLHGEGMPIEICVGDFPKSQSLHLLTSTSFHAIQDNRRLVNSIPQNVLKLWNIKAASVDFLVCCARRLTFNWTVQKLIQFQADPLVAILHELLDTFSTNPNSATIRLTCILVVQACAALRSSDYLHDGLDVLLSLVWSQSISATDSSKAETFVQFYSELIVVCSRYDNQECLMKAITPLLVALNRTIESQLRRELTVRQSSSQVYHPTTFDHPQILRKCFAKILSCRNSILFSTMPTTCNTTKALLSSLMTKLSLLYDEPDKWIDTSICESDRFLMIKGLQKIGILGLHSEYSSCTEKVDYTMPNSELKHILQSLLLCLSEELKTILINTFAECGTLHASPDCKEKQNDRFLTKVAYRCELPINDFLQEDLIVQIFSYLNYKRLVRMRLVCRNWKNIADKQSLWYQNYNKRFKHPKKETEKFLRNPTLLYWLEVFKTRHKRERAIRNKKSIKHPGWRIRLCNHFKCTSVLRSPDAMRKHNRKHKASITRRV